MVASEVGFSSMKLVIWHLYILLMSIKADHLYPAPQKLCGIGGTQ
jgi:hypothetical protein